MTDTVPTRAALITAYGAGTPPNFAFCGGWLDAGDGYGGVFQYMPALTAPYTDPYGMPVVVDAQARVWVCVELEPSLKVTPPALGSDCVGAGNSIMKGQASSYYPTCGFHYLFSNQLGLNPVNLAIPGSGALNADSVIFGGYGPSMGKRNKMLALMTTVNDALYGNSLTPAKVFNDMCCAFADWFCATSMPASAATQIPPSSWSGVTGFNQKAISVGGLMQDTSVTGNMLTGTFNGQNLFVRSASSDGMSANSLRYIDLWIDDPGTYLLADRVAIINSDFAYDNNPVDSGSSLGHFITPVWDRSLGSHTFTAKSGAKSFSGSAISLVDTFDTLRPPCLADPIMVWGTTRPTDWTIPPGTETPALFDDVERAVLRAIKVFTSRGYQIGYARSLDFLDPANISPTDKLHPLNPGHAQIARAGLVQIRF